VKRTIFFILGCLFLVVGIIGVILPGIPGTVNLILAAGFFAKSNPRIEHWMLTHPVLGPPIVNWRETRSMRRKHKVMAISMMWAGIMFTWYQAPLIAGILATLLALWGTWYIATRPEPLPVVSR